MKLSIDFETRSLLDVTAVGVFRYVEHPSTSIWCLAWAFDDDEVHVWRPGDPAPRPVLDHIKGGGLICAWNAQFEKAVWPLLRFDVHPRNEQWVCSAALAARAGLPRRLGDAAKVLGIPQQKDAAGHRLMLKMTKPRKPRPGEDPTGVYWHDNPADITRLGEYCRRDVEAERGVLAHLPAVGHPMERRLWLLDQTINERGVKVDLPLVRQALAVSNDAVAAINARLSEITDGAVPRITNLGRMKQHLGLNGPLNKPALRELLRADLSPEVREILTLRQEGGKSSTAKLKTMLATTCHDDRIRGMLLYYGASTGRWSGRLVQPQNFPRGIEWGAGGNPTLEEAVALLRSGDWRLVESLLPEHLPLMDVLASVLRGCFIADDGCDLIAADFTAIEARVLAWLAGSEKLLHCYHTGGSAYLDMSEVIYDRRVDKKKDPIEYQVSKNTVLGCGYQMGWETFQRQLFDQTGIQLEDDLCQRAVTGYRQLYWEIPALWKALNRTVQVTVSGHITSWVEVPGAAGGLAFAMDPSGWLKMRLPSGRSLWYPEPRMSKCWAPWGDEVPCVTTAGSEQGRPWKRQALYGGLLTENAVQAIARDLMAEAMLRVEAAGYPVILTVHDEIVTEPPEGHGSVEDFCQLMSTVPDWAAGCPVAAEGWRGKRYRK